MQLVDMIFVVAVIVMSAVIHEVMHGVAANRLGDPTARLAGRLTLNPLRHLDPFGSVILPLIFVLTNSPVLFGWAKPVPYNPYNLRPGRFSEAIVAGAGPLSNAIIAVLFALILRIGVGGGWENLIFIVIVVNVMMALFNMVPVPPLDGSKVLASILPHPLSSVYDRFRDSLELNPLLGMGVVLMFILIFGSAFGSLVWSVAHLLAGM